MAYTAHHPTRALPSDQLRELVPGWGSDLDPADRPNFPKLQFDLEATGAHWDFPERQDQKVPRERSIEHEFLTPVFGTAQPTHGVSGVIRRFAYARFSEARLAHWLLLIAADRVEAGGSHLTSLLTLHPDNPITETGVMAEFTRHGLSSRARESRADLRHGWIDPILVAGPWVIGGYVALRVLRSLARR
jgi:hypothetical protein